MTDDADPVRARRDRGRRRRRGVTGCRGPPPAHHPLRRQPAHQDARGADRPRPAGALQAGAADRGGRGDRPARPAGRAARARHVAVLGADAGDADGGTMRCPSRSTPTRWPPGSWRRSPGSRAAASGRLRTAPRRPGLHRRTARVRHRHGRRDLAGDAGGGMPGESRSERCATRRSRPRRSSRGGSPDGAVARGARRRARSWTSTGATICRRAGCARAGVDPAAPPRHYVPASNDFATAVRLGLGWALLPRFQSHEALDAR